MEKIILSDVDGVMLWWKRSFDEWMRSYGYSSSGVHDSYEIEDLYGITRTKANELVKHFNESVYMGYLPPLRDAIKYIRKLHEEHGYVFHCITAVGTHPLIHKMRQENLERTFGKSVVERLVCVESSYAKEPILSEYKNSGLFWIEDKPSNADMGYDLGLRSILINHDYNQKETGNFQRVDYWQDIYNIIECSSR